MTGNQIAHNLRILSFHERLKIHRRQVAALLGEVHALVKYIGDSTAHAGGKIPATLTQHEHQALGHVFTAMIANAFDDGSCSGIPHGETLAGYAVEESSPAGCAVESAVADQEVFFSGKA